MARLNKIWKDRAVHYYWDIIKIRKHNLLYLLYPKTIRKQDKKRIDAFEMRIRCKMLKTAHIGSREKINV